MVNCDGEPKFAHTNEDGAKFVQVKWNHSRDRRLIAAYNVMEALQRFEMTLRSNSDFAGASAVKMCCDIVDGIEGYRVSFLD